MSVKAARQWFRFENAAADENPTVAEIHIIDFIGSWDDDWFARNFGYEMGVTARSFVEQLAALPDSVKNIHVHINSPGGDVQAGINIANALREQASKGRTVETYVDGIAASIASVIAMAGSKVCMADNALMMIHDPYSWTVGNATEMRKTADVLDTMRGQIIATYKWHVSGLSDEALAELMASETWMNADEAIAKGFATEKAEGLKAAASITPRALDLLKVPDHYKTRITAFIAKPEPPAPKPEPAAAADVLRLCAEAGLDLTFAQGLIDAKDTLDAATGKVAAEKQVRTQAAERTTAITTLCTAAKLPDRAALYVKSALSLDDIKKDLTNLTAALDHGEIDGSLNPDHGTRAKARIKVSAVYADLNRPRAN